MFCIFIDSVAGQVTCHRSYGQSRKFGVWNAYNRRPIILKAGDPTATWNYTIATFRAANGDSANSLTVFTGLAEEMFDVLGHAKSDSSSTNIQTQNGIGWNSTTTLSGFGGHDTHASALDEAQMHAMYTNVPDLGINVATALEHSVATGTTTWSGTENGLLLTVKYEG